VDKAPATGFDCGNRVPAGGLPGTPAASWQSPCAAAPADKDNGAGDRE